MLVSLGFVFGTNIALCIIYYMTLIQHAYAAPFSDLHSARHSQKCVQISSIKHMSGLNSTKKKHQPSLMNSAVISQTKTVRFDGKTVNMATLAQAMELAASQFIPVSAGPGCEREIILFDFRVISDLRNPAARTTTVVND